jgi:DnaJ-domain-containing protein 1
MMEDRFEHNDDFTDNGSAKIFFEQNKRRILKSLEGDVEHEEGTYNWYEKWEQWARQQYEQQRQQYEQQQQRTYDYGRQQRARRPKPKVDYQWDFDPNDPYSVLGLKRGATKEEVSAAYRKEMLKHHPDMQAGKSEAERQRAQERSKLINEAYRKIRKSMK